jgi:dihydrofolate synthase/folylpolyglutamate synthase
MDNIKPSQDSEQDTWSLDRWLLHLAQIHPSEIELGLQRVALVLHNLSLDFSLSTIVTVAGTNGKGTTCAFIEQALLLQGQSVGVFSSPHLLDYKERVRVGGQMLNEAAHCAAFLKVEQARANIALTYFEFGTLAALQLMFDSQLDYLLLEVGLGGRLDSVNVVDADVAVITSIDLDHQAWLGNTRELIATEKAGIFRANIPAIIGEPEPPASLKRAARRYKVQASWQDIDFEYHIDQTGFHWQGQHRQFKALPVPRIPAQNAATAIQVLEVLGCSLDHQAMCQVVAQTALPGRRQILQLAPQVMLDVAHNPQATRLLAGDIKQQKFNRVLAVVAMLADKDIGATLTPMLDVVSQWFCATLDESRAAPTDTLVESLSCGQKVLSFSSVTLAYEQALRQASQDDLIIVFGSFFTVAELLNTLKKDV